MTSILFLCVANAARSQMAEGLARQILGPGVRVESAGSRPGAVSPYAIAVLAELGIDIERHRAKGLDTVSGQSFDIVVTLCAEAECPALPGGVRRLHWPIEDPAGYSPNTPQEAVLARFRRARDAIGARLAGLAVELGLSRVNSGET